MYSATFGMLWSVCTSTFIPFFSVFVATGNSACPQTGAPKKTKTPNNNATLLINRIFMLNPHAVTLKLLNSCTLKLFYLLPNRKHAHRSSRPTFQLDRRHNQKRARLRQSTQISQILELIQARAQHQMVHLEILRCPVVRAQCIASYA